MTLPSISELPPDSFDILVLLKTSVWKNVGQDDNMLLWSIIAMVLICVEIYRQSRAITMELFKLLQLAQF